MWGFMSIDIMFHTAINICTISLGIMFIVIRLIVFYKVDFTFEWIFEQMLPKILTQHKLKFDFVNSNHVIA